MSKTHFMVFGSVFLSLASVFRQPREEHATHDGKNWLYNGMNYTMCCHDTRKTLSSPTQLLRDFEGI